MTSAARPPRIDALDVARGLALLAMATYHFAWDFEFFGYADPGMTARGAWKLYARGIASSFLILVGISLVLAHANGIRWPGFWKRLAMVAGAAAAISVATYVAMPSGFIFFGILHQIALGSLLGLVFLRLPWQLTLAAAAAVIAAPHFLRSPMFDQPLLWWLGLAPLNPRSNDYVPVFPWFGAILVGIAMANLAGRLNLWPHLAALKPGGWARPFRFAGRHSLAVYLIHQPVLIACVWIFSQVWPAPIEPPQTAFARTCEASCGETRTALFCTSYCACMLDRIETADMLDSMLSGQGGTELNQRLAGFACFQPGQAG